MGTGGQAAPGTSTEARRAMGHSMNSTSATFLLAVDVGNTAVKLGCFPLPAADPTREPLEVLHLDARGWI